MRFTLSLFSSMGLPFLATTCMDTSPSGTKKNASNVCYVGSHTIPGGGICKQKGKHNHNYNPSSLKEYDLINGCFQHKLFKGQTNPNDQGSQTHQGSQANQGSQPSQIPSSGVDVCPTEQPPNCRGNEQPTVESYRYLEQTCYRTVCKKLTCPRPKRLRCRKGQRAKLFSYWYKNLRCKRYRCVNVSCPKPRSPRCKVGSFVASVRYTYHGKRCLRYVCKSLSCPSPQPPKCSSNQVLKREPYYYHGLRCMRLTCVRVTCPAIRSVRCNPGEQRKLQAYTYKGRKCYKYPLPHRHLSSRPYTEVFTRRKREGCLLQLPRQAVLQKTLCCGQLSS